MRHIPRPRQGAITVVVLVCLLVMMLISASLLRLVQSQHAILKTEERRLQADWLAESGLRRSAARLREDPAYRGETWSLPPRELGGPAEAAVQIVVEPRPGTGEANRRLVTVQADYPSDPRDLRLRVRSRRQAVVAVGAGGAP